MCFSAILSIKGKFDLKDRPKIQCLDEQQRGSSTLVDSANPVSFAFWKCISWLLLQLSKAMWLSSGQTPDLVLCPMHAVFPLPLNGAQENEGLKHVESQDTRSLAPEWQNRAETSLHPFPHLAPNTYLCSIPCRTLTWVRKKVLSCQTSEIWGFIVLYDEISDFSHCWKQFRSFISW